jgi:hypothetical protein
MVFEKVRVCSPPNADKITPIIAFYAVRKSHVYNAHYLIPTSICPRISSTD